MVRLLVRKISSHVYLLRLEDNNVKYFEAMWYIPEGITYNAYLVTLEEGAVLIDTWKHRHASELVEELSKLIDLRDLKYVVIQHMEQDHSGALPEVLKANEFRAVVLGHPMISKMIESYYHIAPKFRAVGDGEAVNLCGSEFKFYYTSWVHWPDNIVTYVPSDKILFSSDAFGSYSIPSSITGEEGVPQEYMNYARKYFATVVGHYRDNTLKALSKLNNLISEVEVLAPAHGMVWKVNREQIINQYIKWSRAEGVKGKVVVIYDSMYGFVEEAITMIGRELTKRGADVVYYGFTDVGHPHLSDVISDALDASAIIVGVSTYEGSAFPAMEFVIDLIIRKVQAKKPVAVVGSYGWGGVAAKRVADKLSKAGFNIVNVLEFRGSPSGEIIEKVRELALQLARTIGT